MPPASWRQTAGRANATSAILTLLYGCGLRISEALGLRRGRGAIGRDAGGHRQRQQATARPGLAGSARSGRRLSRRLPLCADGRTGRSLSAPEAGRSTRASCSGRWRRSAGISASPRPRPRMPCGTALRPIFSAPAAICARSRNCWVTPVCRRRSAIPAVETERLLAIYDAAHPRAQLARGDQTR